MFAKKARVSVVSLGLLAAASWLGASMTLQPAPAPAAKALMVAPLANSCQAAAAAGGNCSDNSDCPGGYCYHDPIALVPYCVYGPVDSFEPQRP